MPDNRIRTHQEVAFIAQDAVEHNVFSVVVEPGFRAVDGIRISAEAIRKAAHGFMKNYQQLYYRHTAPAAAQVIESSIIQEDFTLPGSGEIIRKGSWWMGTHIKDTDLWAEIENGEIRGYSLGGYITEVEPDAERGQGNPGSFPARQDASNRAGGSESRTQIHQDGAGENRERGSGESSGDPGSYPFDPETNIVVGLDVFEVSYAKNPKNQSRAFHIVQEGDFEPEKPGKLAQIQQKLQAFRKICQDFLAETTPGASESSESGKISENSGGKSTDGNTKTAQDENEVENNARSANAESEASNSEGIAAGTGGEAAGGESIGTASENATQTPASASTDVISQDENMQTQQGEDDMQVKARINQDQTTGTAIGTGAAEGTPATPATPAASTQPIGTAAPQPVAMVSQEQHERIVQELHNLRTVVRKKNIEQDVKKDMGHLPIKQEALVSILLEMDVEKYPMHKKVVDLLIQCDRMIKKSALLQEKGRRATGGENGASGKSAMDRIDQEAKKLMDADPKLKLNQAIDRVLEKNPKLYAAYNQEMNAGGGRVEFEMEEDDPGSDGEDGDGDGDSGEGDSGDGDEADNGTDGAGINE